jgi:geranylgeranyl diphosphate synthase type II
MDLRSYLNDRASLVDEALELYLPPAGELPGIIHEAMRYSAVDGGKRIRPVLALAASEAVGGSIEAAMPAGCAIELIHAFSLIHDDLPCMDDDDLRRGKPTSHKVYGEAIALLAGDALLSQAFEIIASTPKVPAERLLEVSRLIARATGTRGMIGGQVLDMQAEGRDVELSDVEAIHTRKTGALLEVSVVVGGILGGGSKEQIEGLSRYGRDIGLAFQVADDILDLTGDAEKIGKPTGSDLRQKKATYPSVIGIEKSRELGEGAIADAIGALAGFGEQAEPLIALAEFIMRRDR